MEFDPVRPVGTPERSVNPPVDHPVMPVAPIERGRGFGGLGGFGGPEPVRRLPNYRQPFNVRNGLSEVM